MLAFCYASFLFTCFKINIFFNYFANTWSFSHYIKKWLLNFWLTLILPNFSLSRYFLKKLVRWRPKSNTRNEDFKISAIADNFITDIVMREIPEIFSKYWMSIANYKYICFFYPNANINKVMHAYII